MAQYDSFLLRVWRSSRQDGGQLSAYLQHLQSGESVRCADGASLLDHLATLLDLDGAGSPSACGEPGTHSAQEGAEDVATVTRT